MLETSTDSNTEEECQRMYLSIYYNLCNSRRQLKESWGKGSSLHRHHIVPVHAGGTDEESNFTYLTVREHIIAHYLLWKIHKRPNDLRSMHMLGANLTPYQRKVVGDFCFQNKIGMFSDEYRGNAELQSERARKAAKTQKENKIGTFSEEGRVKLASAGGRVSGVVQKKNRIGIHNPENFKKNASMGGKAIEGMVWITNGFHRTRIRPEYLQEYLAKGYYKGFSLD
jgi:hypothetical protein